MFVHPIRNGLQSLSEMIIIIVIIIIIRTRLHKFLAFMQNTGIGIGRN